jgi:putative membrane protein
MLTIACVLAGLAALVHVYIFVIESLQFEKPSTLRTFGIRAEDAAVMKPWAFNQGFYNLFLAIGAAAGVVLVGARRRLRAAVVQGAFPLLALLSTGLWWISG